MLQNSGVGKQRCGNGDPVKRQQWDVSDNVLPKERIFRHYLPMRSADRRTQLPYSGCLPAPR